MHIFFTCIFEELRYIMKIYWTMLVLKNTGRTNIRVYIIKEVFFTKKSL